MFGGFPSAHSIQQRGCWIFHFPRFSLSLRHPLAFCFFLLRLVPLPPTTLSHPVLSRLTKTVRWGSTLLALSLSLSLFPVPVSLPFLLLSLSHPSPSLSRWLFLSSGYTGGRTEDVDGLGLASAGRALNNVRTQRGGNTGVRGVPTGMKWNAVEWWNTAEHAPAFLLSPPYPSIGFFSFPSSPFSIRLFLSSSLFSWSLSRTGSLCYSFSLASYVRNEPQLIHHNRFTCMSAGNFHRVFLLSLSLSLSLAVVNVAFDAFRCPILSIAKHPGFRNASWRIAFATIHVEQVSVCFVAGSFVSRAKSVFR